MGNSKNTVMASNPNNKPVCVIIGVGSGNGAANAQKFSQEGYALALISRSMGFISELADQIEDSKAYTCDVMDTENIKILGATGSLRGGANFAAFASAKNAQRALAESMARHLMPKGVHVSLVIIDGSIDEKRSGEDIWIKAEELSTTLYSLTQQDKSAWTFQMDVRPFVEKW